MKSEGKNTMSNKTKIVDSMAANHFNNGFYGQDILSVSQFDQAASTR